MFAVMVVGGGGVAGAAFTAGAAFGLAGALGFAGLLAFFSGAGAGVAGVVLVFDDVAFFMIRSGSLSS